MLALTSEVPDMVMEALPRVTGHGVTLKAETSKPLAWLLEHWAPSFPRSFWPMSKLVPARATARMVHSTAAFIFYYKPQISLNFFTKNERVKMLLVSFLNIQLNEHLVSSRITSLCNARVLPYPLSNSLANNAENMLQYARFKLIINSSPTEDALFQHLEIGVIINCVNDRSRTQNLEIFRVDLSTFVQLDNEIGHGGKTDS